uniref:HOOK N-terminal domain-containing protein n=1 Tax=Labrus bergylta TaxID=56723 RepID=A0A3Q3FKI4_9LABR
MESEVFTPLLEQFMLTPLVCWVNDSDRWLQTIEYVELVDGIYLNEIMLEINPKATVQRTNKKVNNDPTLRIQNLSILIKQIKDYYQTAPLVRISPYVNGQHVFFVGENPICNAIRN